MMSEVQQKRQMISDGFEFLSSFGGNNKCREVIAVDEVSDDDLLAHVMQKLAALLREDVCGWHDLPTSWSNYVLLAIEYFKYPKTDGLKKFCWEDTPTAYRNNIDVVVMAISNQYLDKWEDIPIQAKRNEEVAFVAWKSILRWREEYYSNLTDHCPLLNRDFFRTCIEQEKIDDWNDLPQEFRIDPEFAQSLTVFPSTSIAYSILEEFSDICNDRRTWEKAMNSASIQDYLGNLLELFGPENIVSDRSLMLQACRFDSVLRSVDESLGHDRCFLTEVLQKYPSQLVHLDHDAQSMFPDLVQSILRSFCDLNLSCYAMRRLVDNLHHTFWIERENVKAWFHAGLPHPQLLQCRNNPLGDDYGYDKEIILLIAEHCTTNYRHESFAMIISPCLSGQKSFMKKSMEFDPRLILCAETSLQWDFDLVIEAFGRCKDVYEFYKEKYGDRLPNVVNRVTERLLLHQVYVIFLAGVGQSKCKLSMLRRGTETTISFNKHIAAYLDVPFGQELRWLRQCAAYTTE